MLDRPATAGVVVCRVRVAELASSLPLAAFGRMKSTAFTVIFGNELNPSIVQDTVHGGATADDNEFPDAAIEAHEIITGIEGLVTVTRLSVA